MGNIYLFSLIAGLASALVLIPFTGRRTNKKEEKKSKTGVMLIGIALIIIFIFTFYYVTNLDRNFTSLWGLAIPVTLLGTIFASGKERLIKGALFLGSLVFGAVLLSAFVFNANEKYEVAKMSEKIEIETFSESETPASVPPKFARNKMKKRLARFQTQAITNLEICKFKRLMENMYI